MTVTDRNIYCAFLLSLSAHVAGLIPLWGTASHASYSKQASECKLSIGSIRVCETPRPSNQAFLQPRDGTADDPTKTKETPPEKNKESVKSQKRVPKADLKSVSKSTSPKKSPPLASRTRVVTSPSSKGDSGRTTTTSGWGRENYFNLIRRKIAEAKQYPPEAANEGSEGTAIVGFDLHRNGTVSNVRLLKSSLSGILDLEAQKTVQRAAPFPIVPTRIKGEPLNMRIPLSFEIVRR